MRTRFAPTPSGYLHRGNLLNAAITSRLASEMDGELVLRIDSDDDDRCRPEFTEYIFRALHELGITWHSGPGTFDEFAGIDRAARKEYLRSQLTLIPPDLTFACSCTRSSLLTFACECRGKDLPLSTGQTSLRLYVDPAVMVDLDERRLPLRNALGDPVLWRRDDSPAYHWANVIDDRDLGTTHVVRGEDLLSSSALHRHLAAAIGAGSIANAVYLHHALVRNEAGEKLSKRAQPTQQPLPLDADEITRIHELAAALAAELQRDDATHRAEGPAT
ncbi:MAG: glutamate--tRNA ligase family protein [Candidatus Nanopelagicales bacterium]